MTWCPNKKKKQQGECSFRRTHLEVYPKQKKLAPSKRTDASF
jgi:hypothetical protein